MLSVFSSTRTSFGARRFSNFCALAPVCARLTKVSHLSGVSERLEAELAGRLAFDFKRSGAIEAAKVKGLVAKLVSVKDLAHCSALEVVAGGKLYQVIFKKENRKNPRLKSAYHQKVHTRGKKTRAHGPRKARPKQTLL